MKIIKYYEEENNSILSIKDEVIKNNVEQMEILDEDEKINLLISPEEQFKNNPNYNFFKIFGILFCRIGKTITCNFDSKNNNKPNICIGPNWYLSIILNIFTIASLSFIYFFLIFESKFWEKLLYFILIFLLFFNFNRCVLINPGIVQNTKKDKKNFEFCNICQVYFNPNDNVEHCNMCGICIERYDHHCIWVGKCIGKNNCFTFYTMLGLVFINYAYITFLVYSLYSNKILRNDKSPN